MCGRTGAGSPALLPPQYASTLTQWFGLSAAALPYVLPYIGSPRCADQICMLMPTKVGVNLGIAYAMQLPDPKKILEGAGKLHRHVKLERKSDLETAALKALLKAAPARREKAGKHQESKNHIKESKVGVFQKKRAVGKREVRPGWTSRRETPRLSWS
jgi:hypothetical protein